MTTMKATEIAVLIDHIQQDYPVEAHQIKDYLSQVCKETTLESLVREMIQAKEQSKAAEQQTAALLASWAPIMDGVKVALMRIANEDSRRNLLEEKRLKLEEHRMSNDIEEKKLKYQHILAPIVTCIAGAVAAWVALATGIGA